MSIQLSSAVLASEGIGMRYVGVEELSVIIGRAVSTVRTQVTREPWKLPPQPQNKTTTQVQWLLATVWVWMGEQSNITNSPTPPISASSKKRRGAPNAAEKLAALGAGMSVRELRAAQIDGSQS